MNKTRCTYIALEIYDNNDQQFKEFHRKSSKIMSVKLLIIVIIVFKHYPSSVVHTI